MNRSGLLVRVTALVRKEMRQMLRDRSNLAVGLLLPALLILLFGYGLSLDVENAPVAVVLDDRAPEARELAASLRGSQALAPIQADTMPAAISLMRSGQVAAIVHIPADFSERLAAREARVQLLLNGVDTNTASAIEGYVSGALGVWQQKLQARQGSAEGAGIQLVQRMWFNEASNSTWYLVPGLVVLVLTLIGAFLTSLLIAREWERGTLESLFVTPVRPIELVLAKVLPYLAVGLFDLVLCILMARLLFEVPMRGSLWVILLVSTLYLIVSLLLGLFFSGVTRNQFQASQVALLTSFLPAMMLSGFVFDLRNMPIVVQAISQLLPATHFMSTVKTLFLAGDAWPMVVRNSAILLTYAVLLAWGTTRTLRKRLD